MRKQFFAAMAVAALGLAGGSTARADYGYGYAIQDLRMTVQGLDASSNSTATGQYFNSSGSTLAVLKPGGSAGDTTGPAAAPADPLEAWVSSGGTKPGENDFYTTGPGTLPATPGGAPFFQVNPTNFNYARADSLITSTDMFGAGFRAVNVASSNAIYPPPPGAEGSANGNWTITGNFTVSAASNMQVNFDYANKLQVATSKSGTADATFKVDVTFYDVTNGTPVLVQGVGLSPLELNHSLFVDGTNSAKGTATDHTEGFLFAPGHLYNIVISGSEVVHTRAVPEPGSVISLAVGLGIAGGYGLRRRRRARASHPAG